MNKIERISRIPDNDPWYVRSMMDAAWDSNYWLFPESTRDFRWFANVDLDRPF